MNVVANVTEIQIDSTPIRTKNAKPVYCITDGKIYASVADAAIAEGTHLSNISCACRGKTSMANGKKWCFVKELQAHITDISSTMESLRNDAEKYRAIEAERQAKEQREEEHRKAQERVAALKAKQDELKEKQDALVKELAKAMAMESELAAVVLH